MISGELSSIVIAFIRCLVAAVVLFIFWRIQPLRRYPSRKNILLFVLSGLSGFSIYLIFFTLGMNTVTSSESSVIIALTPVISAILSYILFKEKLTKIGWLATVIAFFGVAFLMLWGNGLSIKPGMLWTLAASILFAIYNIVNRKLASQGYSALDIVTFSMIIAAISLIPVIPEAVSEIERASSMPVLLAIYLAVMPSALAYALWSKALSIADKTSSVTNFMFITPLFASVLGFIMLDEIPTIGTYIGGFIIISMVVLFNAAESRKGN